LLRLPERTRVASEGPFGGALRPVLVFVPTWPLNRVSFALMRRRLRREGWTEAVGVGLPIVGGDLLAAARALADAIDALSPADHRRPVILVAHGTGGLVCRAYLRWCGGTSRVAKLLTLATPHGGSKLYVLAISRFLWELRPDSDALRALAEDDPVPSAVDTTAVYSSFDLSIVPSRLAYYPGAGNIEVEGVGHFSMLWSRRVHQLVRENLEYVVPRTAAAAEGSNRQPAA
jgi:triacylglycerol lipase